MSAAATPLVNAERATPAAARDVLEGAVAAVAEQLRRTVLVADEQIDEAVVVDVGPRRRLRAGGRAGQAARDRHVGERAVAVVAEQRLALRRLPPAAQHEHVLAAVVVVVGLQQVQPAELARQPGARAPRRESAGRRRGGTAASRPQLSKLEVRISSVPSLSKSSTTTPPADENESTPSAGATSVNRPMLSADANADGGDQVRRRHAAGIRPGRHVREVEQPGQLAVARAGARAPSRSSRSPCARRADRRAPAASATSRQRSPGRAEHAVVHLGLVQVRDAEHLLELRQALGKVLHRAAAAPARTARSARPCGRRRRAAVRG